MRSPQGRRFAVATSSLAVKAAPRSPWSKVSSPLGPWPRNGGWLRWDLTAQLNMIRSGKVLSMTHRSVPPPLPALRSVRARDQEPLRYSWGQAAEGSQPLTSSSGQGTPRPQCTRGCIARTLHPALPSQPCRPRKLSAVAIRRGPDSRRLFPLAKDDLAAEAHRSLKEFKKAKLAVERLSTSGAAQRLSATTGRTTAAVLVADVGDARDYPSTRAYCWAAQVLD